MDSSVASTLKEARGAKGLELSDIAEITNVRKEYLKALEEGRYSDLPEDIYSRNFLRLYAQALGLEDSKLLDQYTRERRSALGITPDEPRKVQEMILGESSPRRNPAGWILTLLLLAALVGLGYFASSRNLLSGLFRPSADPVVRTEPTFPDVSNSTEEGLEPSEPLNDEITTPETSLEESVSPSVVDVTTLLESTESPTDTDEDTQDLSESLPETTNETLSSETAQTENNTTEEVLSETETPDTSELAATPVTEETLEPSPNPEVIDVRFTLITDPPGADASLDNYPFASRTPVFNAPVSAREARVLRIELEGYETYEELLDVLNDTSLSITMRPLGSEEANVLDPETQTSAISPTLSANSQGQLRLQVEVETWLEVYQSTKRGEGEQLYYGTAQPSETLSYDLPVYIHVGNAAGIRINENGRDVGLMGSSGEVTGRSFGQPLPVTENSVTEDSIIEDPNNQTTDETALDENTTDENPTEPQTTENE